MRIISKTDELKDKLEAGLKLSFIRLLEFKKQKNSVLVVIKDNKIVKLKPEEFEKLY